MTGWGQRAGSGDGVWVLLPTYNERDNLETVVSQVLKFLPAARVLVIDDNSPDGTGRLADVIASTDARISVLHRTSKAGLGKAYRAGFSRALRDPACVAVVQMDCDMSHDPSAIPELLDALRTGAGLAIGSRYVQGGSTPGWGLRRRLISRGGSVFARIVLALPHRDLTGGFKAWRPEVLARVTEADGYASGYGFQIEMTWRAHQCNTPICEVPITFRNRSYGASKMSGSIIREAMLMVVRLRWMALTNRID